MFILYAVILGILTGLITDGSLSNLSNTNFRWKSAALLSFTLQLFLFNHIGFIESLGSTLIVCLHLLSYVGLLIFVAVNIKVPGIAIIGTGIFLNFLVITLNGGYMPTTLSRIAQDNTENNVIGMSKRTLLPWLGDVFHFPFHIPFATVFSAGDIIIAVGVCIYLILNMKPPKKHITFEIGSKLHIF